MPRLFQQYPDQKFVQGVPKQVDLTDYAKNAGSVLPGIGDAISAYDTYKSLREGNYGEAGLNALGILPFVPALGGMVKSNVLDISKQLAEKEAKVGSDIWNSLRFDEYTKNIPEIQKRTEELTPIFDNIQNKYKEYFSPYFITEDYFNKTKAKINDAYEGILNSSSLKDFNKNFESLKVGLDRAEKIKEEYFNLLKDLGDVHVGKPKLEVIENLMYKDPFGDTTK